MFFFPFSYRKCFQRTSNCGFFVLHLFTCCVLSSRAGAILLLVELLA